MIRETSLQMLNSKRCKMFVTIHDYYLFLGQISDTGQSDWLE